MSSTLNPPSKTPPRTPVPGNREPAMEKALEETRQPITPANPIVDPGKPASAPETKP